MEHCTHEYESGCSCCRNECSHLDARETAMIALALWQANPEIISLQVTGEVTRADLDTLAQKVMDIYTGALS
jgi:hypothetical protein